MHRAEGHSWWLVAAVAVLGSSGCDGHLVGTRDVELEYRAAGLTNETAPHGARDLEGLIRERINAADLSADVRADGAGHVRVTADEGAVEEIDELILWPGGLALYVVDPEFSLDPRRTEGASTSSALTPETDVSASGSPVRYFVGPPLAVSRAARATPPSEGHRLVSDASASPLARTRVVFDPPLADLRAGIASAEARGPLLELTLTESGRAAVARASATRGGRDVAFVRDAAVLAIGPIEPAGDKMTISFGSTPRAYTRAENAARLLRTPRLPRLVRTAATHRPPSYALGFAEIALPMLMSLAWLAFVRRFDRARPEPLWLVLLTFALGGAAVVPASFVEWRLADASPYTNPQLMTFGGQLSALPVAIVVFALTVGLVEEGAKFLAAWAVARQRREFDEPVDGIVYAAAAALGFAALESVRYFAAGRVAGTVVVTRAFMSAPAHFLFSALWGYALGKKLVDRKSRVWPFFLLSVLAHGTFDACLSFPATAHFAPLLNFGLASAFVVMLRRALRYGPVVPNRPAAPRAAPEVFPVGSRMLFAVFVLGLHASAALVFFLGVYIEQSHDRVGPPFVLASTMLLAIVGMTAYGVSASLPLDVVLDEAGVTFGGAFVAWEDVAKVERQRGPGAGRDGHSIVLTGRGARLTLGPSNAPAMEAILAAVYARMSLAAETAAVREESRAAT
jgi:RsiW-degrading membrane proteinase PrsW (M82 family)